MAVHKLMILTGEACKAFASDGLRQGRDAAAASGKLTLRPSSFSTASAQQVGGSTTSSASNGAVAAASGVSTQRAGPSLAGVTPLQCSWSGEAMVAVWYGSRLKLIAAEDNIGRLEGVRSNAMPGSTTALPATPLLLLLREVDWTAVVLQGCATDDFSTMALRMLHCLTSASHATLDTLVIDMPVQMIASVLNALYYVHTEVCFGCGPIVL